MRQIAALLLLIGAAGAGLQAAGVGPAAPAEAQMRSAKVKGLAVARKWCARCHIVAAGQKGPALDAAPPFADVANDPKITPARLRGFLRNPHGRMPTEQLSRDEINDLITYIESLKRK